TRGDSMSFFRASVSLLVRLGFSALCRGGSGTRLHRLTAQVDTLIERRLALPQAFDGGAAFLRVEPPLARSGGGLGRPARTRRHRGAADQFDETRARVLAGARLGAVAGGGGHRPPLPGGRAAREAFEPRAQAVGKARRAAHVEAKLNGARKLVDVLPAGARGANELLLELALGDADQRGDADHR